MKNSRHLITWCLILAWVGSGRAATWIVAQDGQGHFTSVQSAVNAASGSDTLLVRPGTYDEQVRIGNRGGLVIKGDGSPESIIIRGDTIVVGIWDADPAVRVEGLTLTGAHVMGALWVQASKAEIVGCILRENNGPGSCTGVGGAGRILFSSDVLIENCIIEENHGWEAPGGLIIWGSRADIRGNVFRNNSACYGGGIEIYHCEDTGVSVIEYNVFEGNSASEWGGGLLNVDSSPVIQNNTFVANGDGKAAIWILGGSPQISQNILVDSEWAIYCQSRSDFPPSTPVVGDNLCWSIVNEAVANCPADGPLRVQDPLFCGMATGNYALCAESPAASEGVRTYGALDVGCGSCDVTAVAPLTWGEVKSLFRDAPKEAR